MRSGSFSPLYGSMGALCGQHRTKEGFVCRIGFVVGFGLWNGGDRRGLRSFANNLTGY